VAGRKQALIDRINRLIGPRSGQWLTGVRPGLPEVMVDDPRLLSYREAPTGAGVGTTASVAEGSLHTFPLGAISCHPWVVGLRRAADPDQLAGVRSTLSRYYAWVQPANAAQWLDVLPRSCGPMGDLPAVAAVMPWSLTSPQRALADAQARAERERRGYRVGRSVQLGSPTFGPLADVQIAAEAAKLVALRRTLQRAGLDPSRPDYDVGAVFLVHDGCVRWYCTAGRHRAAVMVSLGASELPLTVRAVVRRDEVDLWPQVRAGNVERTAALEVFDRLLEGRPPSIAAHWTAWVEQHTP
jgi:hypothetical protein